MKTIHIDGGLKVMTFGAPPKNFDPMAASAAELQKFGFPPRPTDARQLDRYKKVFGRLKGKLNYVEPAFRVNPNKVHGPRQRRPTDGSETSTNWSGGVVFAPAGDSFKYLEGDWVVPNVDAPTEGQWYYCSSWIGLDGDNSNDVFQAGIECEVFRSGTSITRNIYPWWEWFPAFEVQITTLAVNPGDLITVLLCSAPGAGSTTGTVFFTNVTTGVSSSFALSAPSGTSLVGNSAEWIVEAPTVGGAQSALADYGEVFFSVCEAVTNNGATVNGGTGDNINLTAGGSDVSDGILITPTIVQCEYVGTRP